MSLKSILKDAVYNSARIFVPARPNAIILMYHSIGLNEYSFTVSRRSFAQQMSWLRASGFNLVSLDQLAKYREAGAIPKKTLSITFDDGYEDNYTNAFPILQQHGIPATIFVTTGDLREKKIDSLPPLPKMSEVQLLKLHESGLIAIEPHSETHPRFGNISEDQIERETRESKSYIDLLLKKNCRHFAYPKGSYSKEAQRILARSGVRFAYTTNFGRVQSFDDPYAIKRNGIGANVTFNQFKGIATLGYLRVHAFFFEKQEQFMT
jgi:peptidoglycan/xylan/chitin deacetylase (PgdA/CDA1 family)